MYDPGRTLEATSSHPVRRFLRVCAHPVQDRSFRDESRFGALFAPGKLRRGKACRLLPAPLSPLAAPIVCFASDRFLLTKPNTFPHNRNCQRRYAPVVFGMIPEYRSASSRNKHSASPESNSFYAWRKRSREKSLSELLH
jgi:hypothetical protein